MEKSKKIQYLHFVVIILGAILLAVPLFHENMWFDESYSVAMSNHSFSEIWQVGGNDVHPVLYYFCLHILSLVFGSNVIVYRVFSWICVVICSILGYTHMRKDFNERTGLFFSFFALFSPMCGIYATEMRMYSLGILLGAIMMIYAYRIYQKNTRKSTYIIFGISSLLLAYTHYYGLIFAFIVNIILFICLCKRKRDNSTENNLLLFTAVAVIQVLAYLPWGISLMKQVGIVSGGFWISWSFPNTIYEVLTLHLTGNLSFMPIILSTVLYMYVGYMIFTAKKEEQKPAIWCIIIYAIIIVIAYTISKVMTIVILLNRYFIIASVLVFFITAFAVARDKNKWRVCIVCITTFVLFVVSQFQAVRENYAPDSREFVEYLQSNVQQDDIILYAFALNGAVLTTELSQKGFENISYFYNKDHWTVEESYKAYCPYMVIKENLDDILGGYKGIVWLIEPTDSRRLKEEILEKYSEANFMEEVEFHVAYKQYGYMISKVSI